MSYVPGFEHDIFISYASVDDKSTLGQEKGWVTLFQEYLEIKLAQRLGRSGLLKIWRGPLIEGEQIFDQAIKAAVEKSGLFVVLASNGFFASDYCQKELKWFVDKAKKEPFGLQMGDRCRLYCILLNNIPHYQWQKELSRITGHPFEQKFHRISGHAFHDATREDEFGEPTKPDGQLFEKQMRKLVDSLYKMLSAFKDAISPGQPTITEELLAVNKDAPVVYLAEVADSLRPVRKRLIADLENEKVRVVSDIPPPFEAPAHVKKVIEAISQSVLSVHLFDQFAGREIEGEHGISYPQKQVTLATEHGRPQLIWVPKQLDLQTIEEDASEEDARHKEFLHQLENGVRDEARYNFVRESPTALVQVILEKIKQLQSRAEPVETTPAALLDFYTKDNLHAGRLCQLLLENNILPYLNPQEDNPRQNMELFEAMLKKVSSLIILFGNVPESRVRDRLGAALQSSVTQNLAIKLFCIFMVPPEKSHAAPQFNLGAVQVHVINNDPNALLALLRRSGMRGVA